MNNNADFQMTPEQQALDEMQRDLRFYPSPTTQPEVLTREQIAFFNEQGYLAPLTAFTGDDITTNRNNFEELLNQALSQGKDSYSISTAHLKYGRVYDLLTHPAIVSIVVDILGENVIGWGSHYFCKMPGDGKAVAWHQDASYWPLTPSKAVTVWLAIDDSDIENGCMRVVAGSHHHGHMTYRPSSVEDHNVLNQTIENVEQYGTPVPIELKAGQVSLHSDLLLHGSEANMSNRRRCGLTLRYCTPDVQAGLNWSKKGVVVSGTDSYGNWANPPRPENF